jgi:hypothetical protein
MISSLHVQQLVYLAMMELPRDVSSHHHQVTTSWSTHWGGRHAYSRTFELLELPQGWRCSRCSAACASTRLGTFRVCDTRRCHTPPCQASLAAGKKRPSTQLLAPGSQPTAPGEPMAGHWQLDCPSLAPDSRVRLQQTVLCGEARMAVHPPRSIGSICRLLCDLMLSRRRLWLRGLGWHLFELEHQPGPLRCGASVALLHCAGHLPAYQVHMMGLADFARQESARWHV